MRKVTNMDRNIIDEKAERFNRRYRETQTILSGMTDAERSSVQTLHEMWRAGRTFEVGEIVARGDLLYKCLIAHTSQQTWAPEDAPSLWAKIMYKDGIRIIPEVIEAAQAFSAGELGWWGETLYRSLIAANVYTPEQYPAGWEAVDGVNY